MSPETEGDWGEYRRLILQELQRLHEGIADVKSQISLLNSMEISNLKSRIAVMETEIKIKSGIWGALGAIIPVAIGIIWNIVHK